MILVPENRFKEFTEWERREPGDNTLEDTYRMAEKPPVLEKVTGYYTGPSTAVEILPMTGEAEEKAGVRKESDVYHPKSQGTQAGPPGIRCASTGDDNERKKRRTMTKHIHTGKGLPPGWISF